MKKLFRTILPLVSLCAFGVALPSAADSLVLAPSADTFINARFPDNNAGAHTNLDAGSDALLGIRRGLLQFDLGTLPPGATLTSAVLNLTVMKVPPGGGAASFTVHRLSASWGEGTKGGNTGALAASGEATWNASRFLISGWTSPGALADAVPAPSGVAQVAAAFGNQVAWTGAGIMADVQFWQTNQAGNFGWLLVNESEAMASSVLAFGSRENPDSAGRPQLVIGYTPAATSNQLPVVFITSPTNGASFSAPTAVTIEVNASDPDGTVTNVTFVDNGVPLMSVQASPFLVTASVYPGLHVLSATATDNLGASTVSSNISITVNSVTIANPIVPRIPKGNITVELGTIADGMASPLGMAVPDDGSGRMFVYDQDGRIWIVTANGRLKTPLLDISGRLVQLAGYDERGLLGLALHPNFAQNPFLYTYSSEPPGAPGDFQTGVANNHQSVIAEWRISASDTNLVDPGSRREILRIDQPQVNHNGGTMRFGQDGFLYVSLGDGGQANDTGPGHVAAGNAQNLSVILGKLIRIDVEGRNSLNGQYGIPASNPFDGVNGLAEIYAYGLRNPFSFSFDRGGEHQLFLADVGQNKVEEVDIITSGGNYGWNVREGAFWFDPTSGSVVTLPVRPPPANLIDPIAQYDHDDGSAVIGGFVYRGTALPALAGRYVFGDWGSGAPTGRLFYLDAANTVTELRIGPGDRQLGLWLKGFGEGPDGELYVFGSRWLGPSGKTGRMLKIVPVPDPIQMGQLALAAGKVSPSWTGGSGPFLLETKSSMKDPIWLNASVEAQRAAAFDQNGGGAFFRVVDAGHLPRIPFTAFLSGAAEHPANSSSATAFGIFSLDGNTLSFNISYSGLSGTASAAHIHGPSPGSTNGPVMIDLSPYNGGAWGSNGTVSGVLLLSDAQKAIVLSGKTYVNFHTAAFPAGEMRGQVAPANMQVFLSGANESPAISGGGIGLGNLVLVGNQLTFNVTYQGLSGVATASHIHGSADATHNAGVFTNLGTFNGGAYGTSGNLSGTVVLPPTQLAALVDGLTYINFHTAANPGGEIRGQILPQVGAVPFTALLTGLAEKPAPLTNTARGTGTLSLEGNRLTFNLEYSGLSGPATAAHIHGPAPTTASAGVLINFGPFNGGAWGTSGTVSGSLEITTAQRDLILSGQTYVNFHTTANPGGEMRGQIVPVLMNADANGVNEAPNPVVSPGAASGTFALVRDQLSLCVTYAGLLSPATASHLHGPSTFLGTAGVMLNLSPYNGGAYGSSGSLVGTATTTLPATQAIIDGQAYINFHTTNYPGGEIRGQLLR